jgi:DNA-binding response OmpR family regulator
MIPLPGGPQQINRGKLSADFGRKEIRFCEVLLKLTPTEFRLLSALMLEPNRVFNRGELIEKAFGVDYDALERTLDVHILHLRRKMREIDPSGDQYINTMYGMGYRLKME